MSALAAMVMALAGPPADPLPMPQLLGLSPEALAEAVGAPPPASNAPLRMLDGERRIDIYPADALDPSHHGVGHCAAAVDVVAPDGSHILTGFPETPQNPASFPRRPTAYVFENDGLMGIAVRGPSQPPPSGRDVSAQALIEWSRRVSDNSPWNSSPGRLPFSGGAPRSDGALVNEADQHLIFACRLEVVQPPRDPNAAKPLDVEGFMQGLVLLPLALGLPALNEERERAAREGPGLLAQLELGEAVPGGASAFVRDKRGIRLYRDPEDLSYGVIVISFGWDDRRNLMRYNDAAFVGVRDDRVVWVAEPETAKALGLRSAMCRGPDGRMADVRPGCSNTGQFHFGD